MSAPRRADPAALQEVGGHSMGTRWSCRFANPRMLPLEEVRAAVDEALATVVRQMSPWEAESDLSRFNSAPAGTTVSLPAEFVRVLEAALTWSAASDGALDPTMGALVAAWGFGPRAQPEAGPGRKQPPQARELAAALARSGWRKLQFELAAGRLLQPGGLELDLSGIAKGFGVDHALAALARLGIADALMEVGGELRARGRRPDGRAWRVAVETAPGRQACTLELDGLAVATSGDAFHAFEHAGRRYSHTLDPRTGWPVDHDLAAVTVVAADCMQADALATVLMVLGPKDGLRFAQDRGIAALFAPRAGRDLTTTAFRALLA